MNSITDLKTTTGMQCPTSHVTGLACAGCVQCAAPAAPKERPILFQTDMVRALMDGTKTQTRRPYKLLKHPDIACEMAASELVREEQHVINRICPYGQPGDRLWVRESFQPLFAEGIERESETDWKTGRGYRVYYPASDGVQEFMDGDDNLRTTCKPSIHMPRWASRILLEIVSVRVERLQAISEADALAEGVERVENSGYFRRYPAPASFKDCVWTPRASYRSLWEQINGAGSWDANPWVWVVVFKVVQPTTANALEAGRLAALAKMEGK